MTDHLDNDLPAPEDAQDNPALPESTHDQDAPSSSQNQKKSPSVRELFLKYQSLVTLHSNKEE